MTFDSITATDTVVDAMETFDFGDVVSEVEFNPAPNYNPGELSTLRCDVFPLPSDTRHSEGQYETPFRVRVAVQYRPPKGEAIDWRSWLRMPDAVRRHILAQASPDEVGVKTPYHPECFQNGQVLFTVDATFVEYDTYRRHA